MCPDRLEWMQFTLQIYCPNLTWLFICLHASLNGVLAAHLQSKVSEPVLPHLLLVWDRVSCCIVLSVVALLLSNCIRFNLKAGEFLATVRKWGTFEWCLFKYIAPCMMKCQTTDSDAVPLQFTLSAHRCFLCGLLLLNSTVLNTSLPITTCNTATKNSNFYE